MAIAIVICDSFLAYRIVETYTLLGHLDLHSTPDSSTVLAPDFSNLSQITVVRSRKRRSYRCLPPHSYLKEWWDAVVIGWEFNLRTIALGSL